MPIGDTKCRDNIELELNKIVEGDVTDPRYTKDIIILITGKRNFSDSLHNRVKDKITRTHVYDYMEVDLPDTDEYKSLNHERWIQLYKHYDAVVNLPDRYKFIVRFRCDIDWDETIYTGKLNLGRYVKKNEHTVISMQYFEPLLQLQMKKGYFPTCNDGKLKAVEESMGDLIIFHSRDCLLDPRKTDIETMAKGEYKKFDIHHYWTKMFDKTKIKKIINLFHVIRVYKYPPLGDLMPESYTEVPHWGYSLEYKQQQLREEKKIKNENI